MFTERKQDRSASLDGRANQIFLVGVQPVCVVLSRDDVHDLILLARRHFSRPAKQRVRPQRVRGALALESEIHAVRSAPRPHVGDERPHAEPPWRRISALGWGVWPHTERQPAYCDVVLGLADRGIEATLANPAPGSGHIADHINDDLLLHAL